jgi:uncharacterized protein (DUF58 family)
MKPPLEVTAAAQAEDDRSDTRAAGALFTLPGLAALGAVFILSAWFSQAGMLLLSGLFLAAAGLARLSSRLSLAGVRAERLLSSNRFFPGETVECTWRLSNRKPLPLLWAQIEDRLPAGEGGLDEETALRQGILRRSASLLWYRRIDWKASFPAARRGYYPLGPLKTTSGDMLGIYIRSRTETAGEYLIVYPRIVTFDLQMIPSLYPMGESPTALRLFGDPTQAIGIRAYGSGDGLRDIHWKASARAGALHVKVFASTTAFKVALFVDVESFATGAPPDPEALELALSAAGSIAAALARQGSPTGLYVNTRLADTDQPACLAPRAGRGRLMEILEALAKTRAVCSGPWAPFVERHRAALSAGTTLVFVMARPPETLRVVLGSLAACGFRLMVLQIGGHGDPGVPENVPWRRIRHAADLAGAF